MIIHLFSIVLVFAILIYFMIVPKPDYRRPPQNDDDGGDLDLDDLPVPDLPPGICLPINDWEPDYSRPKPQKVA